MSSIWERTGSRAEFRGHHVMERTEDGLGERTRFVEWPKDEQLIAYVERQYPVAPSRRGFEWYWRLVQVTDMSRVVWSGRTETEAGAKRAVLRCAKIREEAMRNAARRERSAS